MEKQMKCWQIQEPQSQHWTLLLQSFNSLSKPQNVLGSAKETLSSEMPRFLRFTSAASFCHRAVKLVSNWQLNWTKTNWTEDELILKTTQTEAEPGLAMLSHSPTPSSYLYGWDIELSQVTTELFQKVRSLVTSHSMIHCSPKHYRRVGNISREGQFDNVCHQARATLLPFSVFYILKENCKFHNTRNNS